MEADGNLLFCLVTILQRKYVPWGSRLPVSGTYSVTGVIHSGTVAPRHTPRGKDFSTNTAELMILPSSALSHSKCRPPPSLSLSHLSCCHLLWDSSVSHCPGEWVARQANYRGHERGSMGYVLSQIPGSRYFVRSQPLVNGTMPGWKRPPASGPVLCQDS